ncbi:hypothetical protein QBC36DRAFT_380670, partial [Triangularia setosa]
MTFEYHNEGVSLDCQRFGWAPLPDPDDDDACSVDDFDIDGPGGKWITALETIQKYFKEATGGWLVSDGMLAQLKIFTSHGWYHQLGDAPGPTAR